jgi:hypothetical protein
VAKVMDFSQVIEVAIVMKVMDVAKLIDGAQMKGGDSVLVAHHTSAVVKKQSKVQCPTAK